MVAPRTRVSRARTQSSACRPLSVVSSRTLRELISSPRFRQRPPTGHWRISSVTLATRVSNLQPLRGLLDAAQAGESTALTSPDQRFQKHSRVGLCVPAASHLLPDPGSCVCKPLRVSHAVSQRQTAGIDKQATHAEPCPEAFRRRCTPDGMYLGTGSGGVEKTKTDLVRRMG
jgi:hypothetical protein